MKALIGHEAFTEAVRWGTRNVPTRPTVPSLACALVEASGDRLSVSCFDYETSSRISVAALVGEAGVALVPGRLLADIARALPAEDVEFTVDGGRVGLVCGDVRFHLPTMPVEDFPTPPAMPETVGTADATALSRAVAQTSVAAGRDDTLPVLTGVELALGERIGLAATDRYRMAVAEVDWHPADAKAPGAKALIPAKTLAALAKSLSSVGGDVTIAASTDEDGDVGLIGFSAGDRSTVSRVLDGRLPDLRALIALEYPTTLKVDTAALALAVRRVSLVGERNSRLRLFAEGDHLTVESGSHGGAADGSQTLGCEYGGELLRLAFNPLYVADALATVDTPTTVFAIDAEGIRVLLTGEDAEGGEVEFRQLLRTLRWEG
ncbi:DNA polymerase III subunit beta [Phytomonospora endophytica]|uniref:DNA polymerase-3 subunit beta n=1 Tax=Phytomonospora endophytica TaxID=714109 RepID=A0A841FC92_9ACTN|nr:DNA polymerase III subunit beta [Phytomonospora endophytica]MBB6033015.1 DNA polymerase-3 subunit beta [Phytomonospora endophytica]GIG65241.1 DNA polymerase III subunit beta [Phytomonospora endophytica]